MLSIKIIINIIALDIFSPIILHLIAAMPINAFYSCPKLHPYWFQPEQIGRLDFLYQDYRTKGNWNKAICQVGLTIPLPPAFNLETTKTESLFIITAPPFIFWVKKEAVVCAASPPTTTYNLETDSKFSHVFYECCNCFLQGIRIRMDTVILYLCILLKRVSLTCLKKKLHFVYCSFFHGKRSLQRHYSLL